MNEYMKGRKRQINSQTNEIENKERSSKGTKNQTNN